MMHNLLISNWQRKIVALAAAIVIWVLVNHSITITKTIPNIPIRLINIPSGKTVEGLLPDGLLNKKMTLTITGSKTVLDQLHPRDLEIVLDATGHGEEWLVEISKKNLVSLNPDVDITHSITSITYNEFVVKLIKSITEPVLLTITKPIGDPPKGYQFLEIWPQHLFQRVTGPETQVKELKEKGLTLTFNLNEITRAELDALRTSETQDAEVAFPIPESWKFVRIPFYNNSEAPLNDPKAKNLNITFLAKDFIPLNLQVPLSIYFPLKYSPTLNPDTYTLAENQVVKKNNGIFVFSEPLFARGVSRLFLDVVRESMQIVITAEPRTSKESLPWSWEFVNPEKLENIYVNRSLALIANQQLLDLQPKLREGFLRSQFRNYMREFTLFDKSGKKLSLHIELAPGMIEVNPSRKDAHHSFKDRS